MAHVYQLRTGEAGEIISAPLGYVLISLGLGLGFQAGPQSGVGGGYTTIQDEGVSLPAETILNFIGAGVIAADDPTHTRTNVTIPGVGSLALATTAPLSGGGLLSSGLTLSVVAFDLTGGYVVSGPVNTFLKGTGAGNTWATLQTQPATPGDNGKVFLASSGDATFLGGSTTGQLLIWNAVTPSWNAGTDIGAQTITTSGGFSMSGTNVPVTGNLRMGNSTTAKFTSSAGATFNMWDVGVTNADNVTYGDASRGTFLLCGAGNAISLTMGATNNKWFNTQLQLATPNFQWSTSASPLLNIQTDTTATNATGKTFAINGQNLTGANTTGGPVRITSGAGSATVGELSLEVNNNATKLLRMNGTGLAFFGATPVAQPARVGQLTDSTTGTPSTTITDSGVVYSQATTNNNNASMLTKVNGVEAVIHALALSA